MRNAELKKMIDEGRGKMDERMKKKDGRRLVELGGLETGRGKKVKG